MKNLKLPLIFVFSCFFGQAMAQDFQAKGLLGAQSFAMVNEQVRPMSEGSESALVMRIPGKDAKFVANVWQNYIKDFYKGKTKWDRRTGEWFTDDVSVSALGGANTVDLYAEVDQSGNDVEFVLWCDLGGAFLSSASHPERFEEAQAILRQFNLEVTKAGIQQELDDQEKELKNLERDLEKLQSANDRYHKDIEKAKEVIQKAEQDIIQNEQDQEQAAKKIENQKEVVEMVRKKLKGM